MSGLHLQEQSCRGQLLALVAGVLRNCSDRIVLWNASRIAYMTADIQGLSGRSMEEMVQLKDGNAAPGQLTPRDFAEWLVRNREALLQREPPFRRLGSKGARND